MNDQAKNIIIGLFVIVSLSLGAWIFMYLNPSVGAGQILQVRFHNIDKVNLGTQVTYAGRPVGKVTEITFLHNARDQAASCDGPIYAYQLTLDIEKGITIYTTDDLYIHTSGLLGERTIAIVPRCGRPDGPPSEPVAKDAIIVAAPGASIENILSTLEKKKFWDNLADTTKSVQEIAKVLNDSERLTDILNNMQELTCHMRGITNGFIRKWPTLELAIDDFAITTSKTKEIATQIASAEGTIGRLLYDDTLFLQASSLLTKGEVLMNDVNNYGLLFHNSKRWQRLRAQRYYELSELSCGGKFRNYFQQELDQIHGSLAQISTSIEDAEASGEECVLMDDRQYREQYGELMRRVRDMEQKLQLYNAHVNTPCTGESCIRS
jgi:phospholipid/cholesterol/gamma-HCH transport system substrate-binding protein